MGFFKDLALIKEIKEKKSDKKYDYPQDTFYRLGAHCDFLTSYRATDMIYAELDDPDIHIIRRYVLYVIPPTPDMSWLVRKVNTCYVDLVIDFKSETGICDESILQEVTQQVMTFNNDFGDLTFQARFMRGWMESYLKQLKELKRKVPKRSVPFFKKQIANLKAVLKQEPVISKAYYANTTFTQPTFTQRTYEEFMEHYGQDGKDTEGVDELPDL